MTDEASEKRKARKRAYYESNKEQVKAHMKAYYKSHKEQVKARVKSYYESHKEQRKAYKKAYRESHKEQVNAYYRTYRKAYYKVHNERMRAYRKAYCESHKEQVKATSRRWRDAHAEKMRVLHRRHGKFIVDLNFPRAVHSGETRKLSCNPVTVRGRHLRWKRDLRMRGVPEDMLDSIVLQMERAHENRRIYLRNWSARRISSNNYTARCSQEQQARLALALTGG